MSEVIKAENVITQAGFAKLCCVSAEAIRRAILADKIDATGKGRDKRILLAGINTIGYLNDRNSQRKNAVKSQPLATPAHILKTEEQIPTSAGHSQKEKPSTEINIKNIIDLDDEEIDISQYSQSDIKKLKDLEAAKKSAQERKKNRGDLIDRKLVTTILGKIYTIEVNQIKPIADKSPSKIAAIFEDEDPDKILKVSQILSSDIAQALNHIKHSVERFLNEINKNSKEQKNAII